MFRSNYCPVRPCRILMKSATSVPTLDHSVELSQSQITGFISSQIHFMKKIQFNNLTSRWVLSRESKKLVVQAREVKTPTALIFYART